MEDQRVRKIVWDRVAEMLGVTFSAVLTGATASKWLRGDGTWSRDTTDDIVIDLATKGLVLKDTQGTPHYWRITVSTVGAIVTTDLGTTKP